MALVLPEQLDSVVYQDRKEKKETLVSMDRMVSLVYQESQDKMALMELMVLLELREIAVIEASLVSKVGGELRKKSTTLKAFNLFY